jgi:catechol 2,3-dioxygenase-like lactoylglutathione lyase family enzyme
MSTFHLSLDVPDLAAATNFYRELFGVDPAKEKPGYAKFELADPPVALALQETGGHGLSHLGIRVESAEEVAAASTRLADKGLVTFDERDTTCCYARQDKVWVSDPAGNRWEVYTVHEDVEEEPHEHVAAGRCC